MKFLVDRCAGRRLAEWLKSQGHDVVEARTLGPDPGDLALLEIASRDGRVVVTLDRDFARLVYVRGIAHAGMMRLPDVPPDERIRLTRTVLERHSEDLATNAIVTVRGERIRISSPHSGQE